MWAFIQFELLFQDVAYLRFYVSGFQKAMLDKDSPYYWVYSKGLFPIKRDPEKDMYIM